MIGQFLRKVLQLFVGWFKICPACQVRIHNKRVSQCLFSYCWSCTQFSKLSISLKLQILEKLAERKSLLRNTAVSRKTIQNVIANKKLLHGVWIAKPSHERCHLKFEQMYEDVSEATYQWLLQVRKKHGESVVCAKAMRLAILLNKPILKHWKNGLLVGKIVMK